MLELQHAGMEYEQPSRFEDSSSLSACSLLTTSTATTINNFGAGRTLGKLFSRGGAALEKILGLIAVRMGRCPSAIRQRVHKCLGRRHATESGRSRKIERLIEKDVLRLIDYTR